MNYRYIKDQENILIENYERDLAVGESVFKYKDLLTLKNKAGVCLYEVVDNIPILRNIDNETDHVNYYYNEKLNELKNRYAIDWPVDSDLNEKQARTAFRLFKDGTYSSVKDIDAAYNIAIDTLEGLT